MVCCYLKLAADFWSAWAAALFHECQVEWTVPERSWSMAHTASLKHSPPRVASVRPGRLPCRAMQLAQTCDGLLVVGSSLQVYSAFRLAKAAKAAQAGLAIVGVGPTRADALADIKQASVVGEALSRLAGLPEMLLPRGA